MNQKTEETRKNFFFGWGVVIEILVNLHIVIKNTTERLYIFPVFPNGNILIIQGRAKVGFQL